MSPPGPDIAIRPARSADLAAVTAIQAERMRRGTAGLTPAPLDLREVTGMRERLAIQGYPCLVAEQAGTVLGFAFAAPFALRPAVRGTVEGMVAVLPAAAGQGVGRALLEALTEACAAKGFRHMVVVLATEGEAAEASQALHAALGFARVGVLAGLAPSVDGQGGEAVLMQRELRPPLRAVA